MTFGVYEPAPTVWGVGRVVVGDVLTPWEVSEADIEDEAESFVPRLAALGLGDDQLVLIVSLLSQAIHVVPFEKAAGKLGALYSSADRTPFDAFRTASLIKQLHANVVIGIDSTVLDGLEEAGRDLGEVFAPVPAVVCVDADAIARLRAAGLQPRGWATLGPTSAVQGVAGDDFVYDETRWTVEAGHGGELLLTNVADRLTPCDRFPTGVHGTVVSPGRLEIPALS
jgi:hypothetical protein